MLNLRREGLLGDGSKRLKSILFVTLDDEQFIEARDLEHLANVRVDVAQNQLAAGALNLLVERDQLAQRGAGHVLNIAKVQQDLLATKLVDQAEKLLADDLDVLLVKNLLYL